MVIVGGGSPVELASVNGVPSLVQKVSQSSVNS